MPTTKVDVCIIGAGAAGLSVAAVTSQLGIKTTLIEKNKMGGDCLNYGCVPSKALLASAKKIHEIHHAHKIGIHATGLEINWDEIKAHIQNTIKTIAPHDSKERFTQLGVNVIFGNAVFLDKRTIQVNNQIIQAKYFVIATGSSAKIPEINGIDQIDYLTNETIFTIKRLPEHLITIGAGPIGCELSQAFRLLGAEVTIIDIATLLPKDDPQMTDIIRQQLQSDGITLYENTSIIQIRQDDAKKIHITIKKNDQTLEISGSHLLLASGRVANVANLDLKKANIDYDQSGIKVNSKLKTTNRHIYAIGDVIGKLQFTHMAGFHAGIVIQNMLFKLPKTDKNQVVPWVTYTYPELAHVGPLFSELQKNHHKIKIISLSFNQNNRAQAEANTSGMIKVAVNHKGYVLAASIVAPLAGEMIYPWIMAITHQMKLSKITAIIAPYPTWGEISKRLAGTYYTPLLFSKKIKRLVHFLFRF